MLESSHLEQLYIFEELALVAFGKSFNHKQSFQNFEFSDLPLTIARGKHCFIDLYFWRRRPTVIHDHHFVGAFQCLQGFNVDSEFTFKKTKKLTAFHSLGELKLKETRTLKPGEVVGINFQQKFIHQNLHQADLTVNLCFRTNDVSKKNLSNYLFTGFKYEKEPLSQNRAYRLLAMCKLGNFDFNSLKLSLSDALDFLILAHDVDSLHPKIIDLKNLLEVRVKKECGISLSEHFTEHHHQMDQLESSYE